MLEAKILWEIMNISMENKYNAEVTLCVKIADIYVNHKNNLIILETWTNSFCSSFKPNLYAICHLL